MNLWNQWYRCVRYFQPDLSRNQNYIYLVVVLLGFTLRTDLAGVTSFIRALWLPPIMHQRLLHFFCYSELESPFSDILEKIAKFFPLYAYP